MDKDRAPVKETRPLVSSPAIAWSLFGIGLLLRLLGLLFNGMHDLPDVIFNWGGGTWQYGLAHLYIRNYGVFSYALYGIAFALAEHLPRFWWAPYKLVLVLLEIMVLLALLLLLPKGRRHWALSLYWVNPWLILHGGWQGFWDAPHTLFALLAALGFLWTTDERVAWTWVGICLMSSALFKPQGLFYFLVPMGIYLTLLFIKRKSLSLLWFAWGLGLVLVLTTGLLLIQGGSLLTIPLYYLGASTAMPNLCNGCLSVWRPVTGVIQAVLGQEGPTWALQLPAPVFSVLYLVILSGTLTLVTVFSWRVLVPQSASSLNAHLSQLTLVIRLFGFAALLLFGLVILRLSLGGESAWVSRIFPPDSRRALLFAPILQFMVAGRYPLVYLVALGITVTLGGVSIIATSQVANLVEWVLQKTDRWRAQAPTITLEHNLSPHLGILLLLAFSSLVIPQLGANAHINHTYAGLVLLIPFATVNKRILSAWASMVVIHFYSLVSAYGLGLGYVMPQYPIEIPLAQSLISQIDATAYPRLLEYQNAANSLIRSYLPNEPIVTILSAVNFVCVLLIIREMFASSKWLHSSSMTRPAPVIQAGQDL